LRDCLADIAALSAIDLAESPDAYSEAMRQAYWDDKDLAGSIAIAFAGISRLLAEARAAEPGPSHDLRSRAKALTYDLASFTWPGWDEPGIVITPPEMRAGFAAARANLRMAQELQADDLALARAYWVLGAHELAAGHADEAQGSFRQAAATAEHAGEIGEAQLATAFAALAAVAIDAGAVAEFDGALAHLATLEGGADLARQVTTAREALGL
jgi:tetratricopeptide (TPR) repeat protein